MTSEAAVCTGLCSTVKVHRQHIDCTGRYVNKNFVTVESQAELQQSFLKIRKTIDQGTIYKLFMNGP